MDSLFHHLLKLMDWEDGNTRTLSVHKLAKDLAKPLGVVLAVAQLVKLLKKFEKL